LPLQWNFEKFLVDQNGKVVNRWASTTTPATIDAEIEKLLAKAPAAGTEPATSTSTAEDPAPVSTAAL
jgi:glutathione peroxidase